MIDTIMIDNVFDAPLEELVNEEFRFELYSDGIFYYEFEQFNISFILGEHNDMVFKEEILMEIITMDLAYFAFHIRTEDGLIDDVQYVYQKRKDLDIHDTRN
jgi:hypothetical protein